MDFTHLNHYVNCPVHPFPSTRDILQSIPHHTIYFLKMDAIHGYFQLALSKESSFLTTFSPSTGEIPVSKSPNRTECFFGQMVLSFRQNGNRTSMGQKDSRRHYHLGTNFKELKDRAHVILQRCTELNIKISLKKLELGNEISFVAHIVSQSGIIPDDSKHKAIAEFPAPKTYLNWDLSRTRKSAHSFCSWSGPHDGNTVPTSKGKYSVGLDRRHAGRIWASQATPHIIYPRVMCKRWDRLIKWSLLFHSQYYIHDHY